MSTVADKIWQAIAVYQIDYVFTVPGKNIIPLLVAVDESPDISSIICASELGAGFMADGYSRASNKFGVVLVIAGPGFNNVFGALVNAHYDSARLLCICGSHDNKHNGKNVFQDSGVVEYDCSIIAANLCSYSCTVNISDVYNKINNLFFYLNSFNLPTLLHIPLDVQSSRQHIKIADKYVDKSFINCNAFKCLEEIIATGELFLFITGSRSIISAQEIAVFCHRYSVPIASTLCSKGVIAETEPYYLGVFGFGLSQRVFEAIQSKEIKCIITLGFDHSERNTAAWSKFEEISLIHLDSVVAKNIRDSATTSKVFITDLSLLFNELLNNDTIDSYLLKTSHIRDTWLSMISSSSPYSMSIEHNDNKLYVDQVLTDLNTSFIKNSNIVVDSGLHRLYCAHLWKTQEIGAYYTSINNAHMGWAIAASIGIKLAKPQMNCICITGDGCMLMSGTEIQTAAKYNIKVLFVVLNNSAHGAMAIPPLSCNNYQIPNHDWSMFAQSLGIAALTITDLHTLNAAVDEFLCTKSALLLDIKCSYNPSVNLNYFYKKLAQ